MLLPQECKDQLKMGADFFEGTSIGAREGTDELTIGAFISRSMKRRPLGHRWSASAIRAVSRTPWKPYVHTADDTLIPSLPPNTAVPPLAPADVPEHVVQPYADSVPRQPRSERRDLENMGCTPGRPGR